MLGTTLLIIGLAGLAGKAWAVFRDVKDPPLGLKAKVAKMRLDTKKADGKETYTYVVTFLMIDKNDYISFEVPQKLFDEMVTKDEGTLTCNIKRQKFISWELSTPGT
ncbi:MAG: DUF2500 domain-containing protein [Defluviitaleaceae bacterium]|nr:DUF2500 domain-containing protein [Defluviitaleaceae bacterium]